MNSLEKELTDKIRVMIANRGITGVRDITPVAVQDSDFWFLDQRGRKWSICLISEGYPTPIKKAVVKKAVAKKVLVSRG